MAKYVPDIDTKRWVVIAPKRSIRPESDLLNKDAANTVCPFCPGNESLTPPEVARVGSGEANQAGWQVRVVPNKYSITDIHEVIIHSPSDTDDIEVLPVEQVTKILTIYRDRYKAHAENGQVLIFCNHGVHAGASLKHPHSQLVVVPKQINLDAVTREPITNIVEKNNFYLTYCPDFSQWPFEVWIAPKKEGAKFGDTQDGELPDLGQVLSTALRRIKKAYDNGLTPRMRDGGEFVYNYYIYQGSNWFIRIIPRLIHRAGFEMGTGLNVNITDPTEAAEVLQKMVVESDK